MTLEKNKAIARVWFERVMNEHELSAVDATYAEDYVHRGPDGHELGRDEARTIARQLIAAVPDRHAAVLEQIAEGDTVVTRWESRGTHTGVLFGRRPTSETVITQGIVMSRVVDGKIVEDWEMLHISDVGRAR